MNRNYVFPLEIISKRPKEYLVYTGGQILIRVTYYNRSLTIALGTF
ncbi:MAG: hypothetical protein JO033_22415 [Acidobacteriaceae bacterium]|nr:hypothetical protein [Acidobacteriaceae bacterium]